MTKIILLSAGGTGGHFFPAIALAEELQKTNCKIHLITDKRCEKYLSTDAKLESHIVNLHIKISGIVNKIRSAFQLITACIKTLFLMIRIKPDVVIGFGGYPTFPSLLAAKALHIPIILHEQNCLLGKSNHFFASSAKLIALSYQETANIDKSLKKKITITGDIVRSSIKKLPQKKNFNSQIFHLFIFGGSQGAKIFSSLIPEAIEILLKQHPDIQLFITQQASKDQQVELAKRYDKLGVKHELSDFFYMMHEIYNKSQLVISRSGASTIAELTSIGLPAIFIPLPDAAEDHQYFNAKAIADNDAGWYFRQNDALAEKLAAKLAKLIADRTLLQNASNKLIARKNDGAKNLAATVLKIM
mgnify:CR=1 FL=1